MGRSGVVGHGGVVGRGGVVLVVFPREVEKSLE